VISTAIDGKRRLNFATFITKKRLNFPAANHYHVDIITHVDFVTGKLSDQEWQILKAVFQQPHVNWHNQNVSQKNVMRPSLFPLPIKTTFNQQHGYLL